MHIKAWAELRGELEYLCAKAGYFEFILDVHTCTPGFKNPSTCFMQSTPFSPKQKVSKL